MFPRKKIDHPDPYTNSGSLDKGNPIPSIRMMRYAIEDFDANSTYWAKRLCVLTIALVFLTIALIVLTIILIVE